MKSFVRKEILQKRGSLPDRELMERGERIKGHFFGLKEFKEAKTVMFYVSKGKEVPTEDLIRRSIRMGKRVLVPLTDLENERIIPCEVKDPDGELEFGAFGVKEPRKGFRRPVDPGDIDLVIVPGVAFDRRGHRLGYGKGFYDRFLAEAKKADSVGLAYRFQVLREVPVEKHDVSVGKVVTEDGILA